MTDKNFRHSGLKIVFRVLFAILTLALMTCIFCLSAESAEVSSQTSAGIIETVVETFVPSYKEMTEVVKKEYISSLQDVVRTLAHFCIFGALGVCSGGFAATFKGKFYLKLIFTHLFCVLYSLSDEYHQTFSMGRSFQLIDIGVDSLGAFLGIVVVLLIALIFTKRKEGVEKVKKSHLLKQIESLTQKILEADEAIKALKDEVLDRDEEIRRLNEKIKLAEVAPVPEISVDEPEDNHIVSEDEPEKLKMKYEDFDFAKESAEVSKEDVNDYAVKAISRIITESVKIGCVLASNDSPDKKELLNLTLGRTEVAKNEISSLIDAHLSSEEKIASIDKEEREVKEYYQSILAQL